MLRRIRVQWFRFTHGEDVFDGWPGQDESPLTALERVSVPVGMLKPTV